MNDHINYPQSFGKKLYLTLYCGFYLSVNNVAQQTNGTPKNKFSLSALVIQCTVQWGSEIQPFFVQLVFMSGY